MAKPLTHAQAQQNRAFLKLLARTGNVRLACREAGLKYGTMQDRRRKHRSFAARWDAALAVAQARLARGDPSTIRSAANGPPPHCSAMERSDLFRTVGGEAVIVRLKDGTVQVRRAQPGKLTREAEQAFLAAVSATCNIRLAAAAVGAAEATFFRRRRKDAAFAREMRMALEEGYLALETALLESGLAGSREHDDWRHNDPPATPPMTANQALQLMYLHQKEARLTAEPWWLRRRRGESEAAHSERLTLMGEERLRLAREKFEVAEVERWERGEPAWGPAGEAVRRELGFPDLAQVAARRRGGGRVHHAGRALFGGWRIEDMEEKRAHPSSGR
jgi:hypothetical protein